MESCRQVYLPGKVQLLLTSISGQSYFMYSMMKSLTNISKQSNEELILVCMKSSHIF